MLAEPCLVSRARAWPERLALVADGETTSYGDLLDESARAASFLLDGRPDLAEARVVLLAPPGSGYVVAQWAVWRAGGLVVPLSSSQAPAEWDYVLRDTAAEIVIGDSVAEPALRRIADARGTRFVERRDVDQRAPGPLPAIPAARGAMILYTSGTTSRPKGVVTTHANLEAQMGALAEAWGWTSDDRVLHVLPLNHVHGIVNVLGCALGAGAVCEFVAPFEARAVWERVVRGAATLFMAVPTIYSKLAAAWDEADHDRRRAWSDGARRLRLMVSGSAALPVTLLEKWQAVTGHVLLERYGMTEIGMALSNPLAGERRPGFVGTPLPGVEVRLVDETGVEVAPGTAGEIEVRGPAVFREYWRRPDSTDEAFRDGWFRTGDVAIVERGSYRILGRRSVDIIKTGGYKVSALEVEEVLREHPDVAECAVVGVPDDEWGERVAAAIVTRGGRTVSVEQFRAFAAPRLAKYKLPTRVAIVADLPRNAMGKVTKLRVKDLFPRSMYN